MSKKRKPAEKLPDTVATAFYVAISEFSRRFGVVPPSEIECRTAEVTFLQGEPAQVPCVTIPLHPGLQAASPCHPEEARRAFRDEYVSIMRNSPDKKVFPPVPEEMVAFLRVFLLHLSRGNGRIRLFPIIVLYDGERETILKDSFITPEGGSTHGRDGDIERISYRGVPVDAYCCADDPTEISRIAGSILEEWVFDEDAGRKASGRMLENFLLCVHDDVEDAVPGVVVYDPEWIGDRFADIIVFETAESVACLDGAILRGKCGRMAAPGIHPAFVLMTEEQDGSALAALYGPIPFDDLDGSLTFRGLVAEAVDESMKIAEWRISESCYGSANLRGLPSGTTVFEQEVGKFSCRILNALRIVLPETDEVTEVTAWRGDGVLRVSGKTCSVSRMSTETAEGEGR